MSQAKLKKEHLRQVMLREVEDLSRPFADEEARLAEEIESLPAIVVERVSQQQLDRMRMRPNQCHANCLFYEQNDPEQKSRLRTGWLDFQWVFDPHSVIERDGRLLCLTPMLIPGASVFKFRPDPAITLDTHRFMVIRNGSALESKVRRNPDLIALYADFIRSRLLAGADPAETAREAACLYLQTPA